MRLTPCLQEALEAVPAQPSPPRPAAPESSVAAAAALLLQAERPLVVVGKGAALSRAEGELREVSVGSELGDSVLPCCSIHAAGAGAGPALADCGHRSSRHRCPPLVTPAHPRPPHSLRRS